MIFFESWNFKELQVLGKGITFAYSLSGSLW